MTKIFTLALLLVGSLSLSAQNWGWGSSKTIRGNGDLINETRDLREFDGVSACCNFEVIITQSSTQSVEIEAESNVMEYISTEVSGGRLEIGFKENVSLKNVKDIVITISMRELEYLGASSSAKIITKTAFDGRDLELDASSGSRITCAFAGEDIRANVSSGAKIILEGKGQSIKADASSGGNIRAKGFVAVEGEANASSGGGVEVQVTDELEADASSGGSVRYTGSVKDVDSDTSSGGSVRRSGPRS